MKEATGELNSTVLVVSAVALLSAFFFIYLWPILKTNYDSHTNCAKAVCESCCKDSELDKYGTCNKTCSEVICYLKENKNNKFTCPYKG